MTRRCGDCQLCCTIVPVPEIGKPGLVRCRYQKFAKGCVLHGTARMPASCRHYECKWLTDPAARDLRRPDRAHYVIDPLPDYIRLTDPDTGAVVHEVPAVQVWLDPRFPDAHRDPAFRDWLDKVGWPAVVRRSPQDGFVLVPPSINADDVWAERESQRCEEHTAADVNRVLRAHGAEIVLVPTEL